MTRAPEVRAYSREAYERDTASAHIPRRDPEWITGQHAADLLGISTNAMTGLRNLLPHKVHPGTPGTTGRRPFMFRRSDIERIRHVRDAALIQTQTAVRVVSAEIGGRL